MKAFHELKEMLCKEVEQVARKGEMSKSDLEMVHKLTDTIKNIDKILMLEEGGGYSQGGHWEADMRGSYNGGNSYANRGQHYVRGHYSRDDGGGYSQSHYSRDGGGSYDRGNSYGGYSRHGDGGKEEMIGQLRDMLEQTTNSKEREAIERCLRQMER